MAVIGTAAMQMVHTLRGSYKHFVISNADTVPGAILVEFLNQIITFCEEEWELKNFDDGLSDRFDSFDACVRANECTPCWADPLCRGEVHSTMICAFMVAGATTGTGLYLIGTFRLGRLISFVPLTVEAAFLAGCGWKIVKSKSLSPQKWSAKSVVGGVLTRNWRRFSWYILFGGGSSTRDSRLH